MCPGTHSSGASNKPVGTGVNNGIVLVDYINTLRARGENMADAIRQSGRQRLRPVLITTLTTVFGMMPLALAGGEGSETWKPMGVTVIGGLSFSTIVTLILVPVLYSLFSRDVHKRHARLLPPELQSEFESAADAVPSPR
jgi:HAE1 family hydrophobic/amphiphilic exporter-1